MKKKLILNYPNLLLAIISFISLFFGIFYLRNAIYDADFFGTIILAGFAWFAVLADKLLKLKLSSFLLIIYYSLLLLTILLGRILHLYDYLSWYRNFTHFLGGIFFSILGIYLITRLDNIGYLKFPVVLTYSLFFSGFMMAIWSIASSFILDSFGKISSGAINRIGVGLIGGIFFSILLILDHLLYHNLYLEKLIRKLS